MVSPLTNQEKIFLAGCIKSMLLSDGIIDEQEISELDVLINHLHFGDFDQRLEEFEASAKDEDGFWEMAKHIERPETREIILRSLREIMLRTGVPNESEEHLIKRLERAWAA